MDAERLLTNFAPTLEQLSDGNPLALAGRIVGFGQAEMSAGVPKWAWFVSGAVVGAGVMLIWAPQVRRVLRLEA